LNLYEHKGGSAPGYPLSNVWIQFPGCSDNMGVWRIGDGGVVFGSRQLSEGLSLGPDGCRDPCLWVPTAVLAAAKARAEVLHIGIDTGCKF
jgi:hypothetical protein